MTVGKYSANSICSLSQSKTPHWRDLCILRIQYFNRAMFPELDHSFKKKYINSFLYDIKLKKKKMPFPPAFPASSSTRRHRFWLPLHWLPVFFFFLIHSKILLITYKTLRGLGFNYLTDVLVPSFPSHILSSLDASFFFVPRSRLFQESDRANIFKMTFQ